MTSSSSRLQASQLTSMQSFGTENDTDSLITFHYPILSLEVDSESLPSLSSSIMSGRSDILSDDNASSLGDSAYEILTDSTILTSDDEDRDDNTDSVASLDDHGVDDVTSLTGTEASEETASTSSRSDSHLETHGIPEFCGLDRDAPTREASSSGVTLRGGERPSTPPIEFEEPAFLGEQVSVTHTVCNFSEQQTFEILKYVRTADPPTRVAATVRQTMAKRGLAIDEPFRVLYVGSPTAKGEIISKIGASLAVPMAETSHRRSSRFNVVPISSFGSSGSPEVELIDSFGLELVVDECTHARTTKTHGKPDTLTLHLNNSFWYRSRCDDSGFHLESPTYWKLPHLAVFYCSDDDNITARQTRLYTRSFMARHAVPAIVISQNPLYGRPVESYTLDTRSVHMCLESRSATLPGNRVLKRLPIDLSTFLNIDARQMNRNLACLTGLHAGRDALQPSDNQQTSSPQNLITKYIKMSPYSHWLSQSLEFLRERKSGRFWLASLVIGLFALVLATAALSPNPDGSAPASWWSRSRGPESYIQLVSTPASSVTGATTATAPSTMLFPQPRDANVAPSSETGQPMSNSVANPNLNFIDILFNPPLTALNDSDKFKLHIIGDSHMILRPPRRFTLLKKPPKIFVRVTRNDRVVDVRLSKLFEGAYTLKLEREDAYGTMNVSVWTKSKPTMEQTFELDFGTPWLKVWGLRKAVRAFSEELQKDVRYAQDGLQTAIGQAAVDARKAMGKASQEARKRVAETQELVVSKAKQLSESVSRQGRIASELAVHAKELSDTIPRQAKRLYRATRSLTSLGELESLRKAQLQARSLWTKDSDKRDARRTARRADRREKRACRKGCRGRR
ncbi:hypothetical protein FGG08_000235 [Glutinoglossum americanum]|uniref:Uncharacterized protein n=1 Tax=Glutinoglossum americanum TaxID=1670608 RepID=A0A9P8IFM5_9PEZI|nr:hypothetical protein FGG08_000235 [Glutinoglossum americanum]